MAPPAPWLLWTLLLLAPTLSSQQGVWDRTTCTEGMVTVPRGQRALMSCTSSSPFTHVEIRLRVPGKPTQLIFRVDTPGSFSSAGWRLVVQGGEAQLVIQDAQPGQAGEYAWVLTGRQRMTKNTRLELSEPPDAVPTVPAPQETVHLGTAMPQPRNHMTVVGISLGVLLCVVGVGLFAWRRSRGPSALERLLQMWTFSAWSPRPEQETDQDPLDPDSSLTSPTPQMPRPQSRPPSPSHLHQH